MIQITTPLSTGLRELADLLDQHPELPTPRVDVGWHRADDPTLTAIVAATSDVTWHAKASASTEWIDAKTDAGIALAVYATPEPTTLDSSRLEALIAAAGA